MAGFSGRDAFCLTLVLLAFYLYIQSLYSNTARRRTLYILSSGLAMMCLGLSWLGAAVFISGIAFIIAESGRLSRVQADAGMLLGYVRQHWQIENRSHWVRGVPFDEDRSQVRVDGPGHRVPSGR